MVVVGIDPGQSGGIAVLSGDTVTAHKMPDTERGLLDILEPLGAQWSGDIFAALERVWSSPGWGHVGAFKFGMSYGSIRTALAAARIPFDEVLPVKWQTALGCRSAGDKNITKRRAQALFPHLTVTHALADALLIATYCQRMRGGYGQKEEGHQSGPAKESGRQKQIRQRVEKARATIAAIAGDGQSPKRAAR